MLRLKPGFFSRRGDSLLEGESVPRQVFHTLGGARSRFLKKCVPFLRFLEIRNPNIFLNLLFNMNNLLPICVAWRFTAPEAGCLVNSQPDFDMIISLYYNIILFYIIFLYDNMFL